jgi:hypothetical protein
VGMSTETVNGNSDVRYRRAIVGRFLTVDEDILANI